MNYCYQPKSCNNCTKLKLIDKKIIYDCKINAIKINFH